MNKTADYIKDRLSLRDPLRDSVDILARLTDDLELQKEVDLVTELEKVKALYPTCTDFERDFPSLAFAIATGVGKTRLMGACITYLYLTKGIRNFFILAPGSTIYEKLIEDFGNPSFRKYVFKGINEFVHNPPVIITGDNYAQQGNLFSEKEVRINVFNIQKFNRDTSASKRGKEKGKAPRIKRLSEYLGQSYWSYLTGLDDLVILMDEAHRYHADASKNAINELKPVLGIELTATPIDDKGNVFRNVVFEYSLAQALADGKYVKHPTIATRKNFDAKKSNAAITERTKLEDAISVHEDTKSVLELYSVENDVKLVKPFILVVCKDTTHAKEVFTMMNRPDFFEGKYQDKVLQIDSTTKKEEDIERQFISLEEPDNEIEIVIHVNMLKEGWDVTNLYTIVPLRASNAAILIEQTIGRGLRLPYEGKRTGVENVDKLTIIAHDNFEQVIKEAQNPDSILNKMSFVELDESDFGEPSEVVSSVSVVEVEIAKEQAAVNEIKDVKKKEKAQTVVDAKKGILDVLPSLNILEGVNNVKDLKKDFAKKKALEQIERNIDKVPNGNLFKKQILEAAAASYDKVVSQYEKNIIEIPRMSLTEGEVTADFKHFDLDTAGFDYQALQEEIIRVSLVDGKTDTLQARFSGTRETPINIIVSEVIDYPEIHYDDTKDLLYHLAQQALDAVQENISDEKDLPKAIFQFRKIIGQRIYIQMKANLEIKIPGYLEPEVVGFVRIEPWNFSALLSNGYKDYREIISPVNRIPKFVFRGFEKAGHFEYKFDSKTEQDFAYVLENDKAVIKWLRPAPKQFRIFWDDNKKQYVPDFVVETSDTIYMVEPKASNQMEAVDVLSKKTAAETYCKYASNFTAKNGGKPWKYALVPHDEVSRTSSFDFLMQKYAGK